MLMDPGLILAIMVGVAVCSVLATVALIGPPRKR